MEARLMVNHNVQGLRIGVGDLPEKKRMDVAVDGWGEQQLDRMRVVHF